MALLEELYLAYYAARKHKRNTKNQLLFEDNMGANLQALETNISNLSYEPYRSVCFMIEEPVKREVFAASFRDRVVHHLIYQQIGPLFEASFINDSYSCRKGKGTHYGIKRLDHHIRSCSKNYTLPTYVLKLDIQGYFMSINKTILFDKIMKKMDKKWENYVSCLKDSAYSLDKETLVYLLEKTIFCDHVKDCIVKGNLSDWNDLPPSKSLFYTDPGCGIPIGNLTSQLFSNIYLNDFDHYMKRTLGLKHYGRYVDDFFVVHNDKEYLKEIIKLSKDYLANHLKLKLHPKKIYLQPIEHGISYLGGFIKPYCINIDKRTRKKVYRRFQEMDKSDNKGYITVEDVLKYRATINSYLGILSHYRAYNLKKELISKYQFPYTYGYYLLRNSRCRFMISNLEMCVNNF